MNYTKEKMYEWQRRHRRRNKERLLEYLLVHPCVDCGEPDPIVLEFDHVTGEKRFQIGDAVSGSTRSWSLIFSEIEKCEVRCANCHKRKTCRQLGHTSKNSRVVADGGGFEPSMT